MSIEEQCLDFLWFCFSISQHSSEVDVFCVQVSAHLIAIDRFLSASVV